jgi:hypothetical protein
MDFFPFPGLHLSSSRHSILSLRAGTTNHFLAVPTKATCSTRECQSLRFRPPSKSPATHIRKNPLVFVAVLIYLYWSRSLKFLSISTSHEVASCSKSPLQLLYCFVAAASCNKSNRISLRCLFSCVYVLLATSSRRSPAPTHGNSNATCMLGLALYAWIYWVFIKTDF